MVINKYKSIEDKGRQQWQMVYDCKYNWRRLNNGDISDYPDVMNIITYRINNEHNCYVGLTYHFKLNKW